MGVEPGKSAFNEEVCVFSEWTSVLQLKSVYSHKVSRCCKVHVLHSRHFKQHFNLGCDGGKKYYTKELKPSAVPMNS